MVSFAFSTSKQSDCLPCRRGSLTASEKKQYIAAVQCISTKPSIIPSELCPGCETRYDDFVATHINQTLSIHGTVSMPLANPTDERILNIQLQGNFLSWHRYFTWSYEKALREECGYTGYQPYWNWPKYAADPVNSPLFDGSETSMSGNGVYKEHDPIYVPSSAAPFITIPPAQGGGCVQSGPFKNFTVRLGPVSPAWSNLTVNPSPTGLGSNPRCLSRDINPVAAAWTKDSNTSSLITDYTDIGSFQATMQGDFASGFLGVHTGGHMTNGADPGGDLFTSPGDPVSLHHHKHTGKKLSPN